MQKIIYPLAFIVLGLIMACDNEVDLNAEYEDATVVYGLIDAFEDTHFVKVNRAFLEDGSNAIELAKDAERFFYDSLQVSMIEASGADTFSLFPIAKPKEPGVFSTEKNIVYYTDATLQPNREYQLKVVQANGKQTTAKTKTLDSVDVVRPGLDRNFDRRPISFVSILGGGRSFQDYEFIVRLTSNIAEVQLKLYFLYDEEVNGNLIPRRVEVPIGGVRNTELANANASLNFNGEFFYQTLKKEIPANNNRKEVSLNRNLLLEVVAIDVTYDQYTSVYGPLDGLAQVRPEFTNVNNGIGLFASRSTYIDISYLPDPSRAELFSGSYTGGLNFVDQ